MSLLSRTVRIASGSDHELEITLIEEESRILQSQVYNIITLIGNRCVAVLVIREDHIPYLKSYITFNSVFFLLLFIDIFFLFTDNFALDPYLYLRFFPFFLPSLFLCAIFYVLHSI